MQNAEADYTSKSLVTVPLCRVALSRSYISTTFSIAYTTSLVPVLDHPDESLPESQMSLMQFVQTAEHLLSSGQTPDDLIRFLRFGSGWTLGV